MRVQRKSTYTPEDARILLVLPPFLHRRFKAAASLKGYSMQETLFKFVEEFVQQLEVDSFIQDQRA